MLPLRVLAFVCVVTVPVVTMETVVGVAGRTVELPCRLEAAEQKGQDVCWGRGEPSLFTCHDAVIHGAGDQVYYRRSHRYRFSASSSFLYIMNSRPSDAGFYHCRVQLPGLFNDQTSTVHLIIITPPSDMSDASSEDSSDGSDDQKKNTPRTEASYSTAGAAQTGSDVSTTAPGVAQMQSSVQQRQVNSLQFFVGNSVRLSFIVFIPALLLTAAYSVWRSKQRSHAVRRLQQEDEISSV